MDCQGLLALPWIEAEKLLQEAGISYDWEITCPSRVFFKTDVIRLYVLRVREHVQGI